MGRRCRPFSPLGACMARFLKKFILIFNNSVAKQVIETNWAKQDNSSGQIHKFVRMNYLGVIKPQNIQKPGYLGKSQQRLICLRNRTCRIYCQIIAWPLRRKGWALAYMMGDWCWNLLQTRKFCWPFWWSPAHSRGRPADPPPPIKTDIWASLLILSESPWRQFLT